MQKSQQYAQKGHKPIAQGNTLGKSITNTNAPCKGKSVNYQCFCPCRAFCYFQSVHPRRCLGLCAFGAFCPLCLTFDSLLNCWTVQFRLQLKRLRTVFQHSRSVGDEYYCMTIVVQQTLEQSAFGVGIEG